MTVSSTPRLAGPFIGSGSPGPFPFAFKVFVPQDIVVVQTAPGGSETVLALTVDYTVSLNVDQNVSPGGSVTLTEPLAGSYLLHVTSGLEATQAARMANLGGFYPRVHEDALDKLTILIQQYFVELMRALRVPELAGVPVLPAASLRRGKLLGFDVVTGHPVVLNPPAGEGGALIIGGNEFQGAQGVAFVELEDGPEIAFDPRASNNFALVLGGDHTVENPDLAFAPDGAVYTFWVTQGEGGDHTLSFGDMFLLPDPAPTLSTPEGAIDIVSFQYRQALGKLSFLGIMKGATAPPLPTLSAPTTTAVTTTTATVGATTDTGGGHLFVAVTTSATPPSAAAIEAGTGFSAAGSQLVTSAGAKTLAITGLLASTTYYHHHVQWAGGYSNVLTGGPFTTESAVPPPPPPPPPPPALSATRSPASVSGSAHGFPADGPKTATTSTVTVSASGGTAPYTYAWSQTEGDSGISATAGTSAATAFTATTTVGNELSATFECVVTDAASATVVVTVYVLLLFVDLT